jgi:hypothetical protein
MPRVVQLLLALVVALLLGALFPLLVVAAPQAMLTAKLRPGKLGAGTAMSVAFHLKPRPGEALPLLNGFTLHLPRGMGFAASELGLATCSSSRLLALGVLGCPHESLMGYGSAQVRVPFGTRSVREQGRVFIFMAKPVEETTTTLLYFDGRSPVIAPIVMQSQVVTATGSSDSVLETSVEAIPSTPDGPEASLVAMQLTLGPKDLRYYRQVDGRRVPYRPEGIRIPARCPQGGFRFEASFTFRDESRRHARTHVPCPPATGGPTRRQGRG